MHTKMELNGDIDSARLPGLPAVPCTELSGRYDTLFKTIVGSGWAVASDGNVESPTGYFARVEIPSREGERDEMLEAVIQFDDKDLRKKFRELEPGWYLTTEDSYGLIWVYWSNEVHVTDAYGHLVEEYDDWTDEDED